MKYMIILQGEDLKEDIDGFVADVERNLEVSSDTWSADNDEGYCISVDKIQFVANP